MTPRVRKLDAGLTLVVCVLAIALGLMALVAHGAESTQGATVRIRQQSCSTVRCTIGSWSGTLIGGLRDQRFAVLTCAHGYDDKATVSVEMRPGTWIEGDVLALDARADLGLLAVAYPDRLPCLELSDVSAAPGTGVTVRGFPRGERYRERSTQVLRDLGTVSVVDSTFIPGESGGSVVANGRLVGVIVGTDLVMPLGLPGPAVLTPKYPNGYIIPQPMVREFVLTANGGQPPTTSGPGQDTPQPFRRRESAPVLADEAEPNLGPATPVLPRERPVATPSTPEAAAPTPVDWSLVKLVVLVPRQESLDKFDAIVRAVEKLSATESGPGKTVRRWINETTDGKADVELVYERVEPTKYREIVTTSGLRVGKYAGVVALVKRQDSGILSPLKTLAARIAERVAERRLPDIPVELLLERTAAAEFEEITAALDRDEPGTADGADVPTGGGLLETVLAGVYAVLRGARKWLESKRGAV
jgi:hypothetical protein